MILPVPSNQKLNAFLKEVADVFGKDNKPTSHIGRATTVTRINGVANEIVSKLLAYTNLITTQHYAKILDLKVSIKLIHL